MRYTTELFDEIENVQFQVTDQHIDEYSNGTLLHRILKTDWPELKNALDALVIPVPAPPITPERYEDRVYDDIDKVTFIFDAATQKFTQTAVGNVIHVFSVADWTELKTKIDAKLA